MFCSRCGSQVQESAAFCAKCGNKLTASPSPPPFQPSPPPYRPKSSAATVVVIVAAVFFVMIAVIGIISAIAIPNLLNAIQRGKQKRSMADIRAIGTACEAYAVDHNAYPDVATVNELAQILEPKYIAHLPRQDGWLKEFYYKPLNPAEDGPQQYIIASAGKDGILEHEDLNGYSRIATGSFNNDIVFTNGAFLQYPELTHR